MWFPWEFTTTHVYSLLERNFVRKCFWQDTGKRLNCSGFWGLIWKVTCAWHDTLLTETTACRKHGISLLMFEIRILWFSEEFFRLLHINCIIQGLY